MTAAEAALRPTGSLAKVQSSGLNRGLGGLTRAELGRWLPWRALGFIVLGLGLLALLYVNWLAQSPAKILTELVWPFFGLWTGLLMLATVAMTQGMVATEISQGTAAWVVAKPVARSAFVLSKFVALVPVVAVAMVGIPGLVARRLFVVAESNGRTEFNAQDLQRLLDEPSERGPYRPLMELDAYVGILVLMTVMILFVAAVMILLGCVLRHSTAILALGLSTPILLIILASVNIDHQIVSLTPAWAMESMLDGVAGDPISIGGPALVTALWMVGMLGVATWWFDRREL